MGYPVFYSDHEARTILSEDNDTKQEVISLFGENAFTNNVPNRAYIAQQVFQNSEKLEKLNALIHPKVRTKFETWKTLQQSPIVFNEAAILFETGAYKNFTKNILVTAPKDLRIARVLARDNSSVEEIEKRMASQWPENKKIALADFIIENNDKAAVLPQLESILKTLRNGY